MGTAFAATRALISIVSESSEYIGMSARPDLPVVLFTLGVSLATGILFGLAPALMASRIGNRGALNTSSRTAQGAGGKGARFWPKALVTFQVTLSLVLLVGAGLLLR